MVALRGLCGGVPGPQLSELIGNMTANPRILVYETSPNGESPLFERLQSQGLCPRRHDLLEAVQQEMLDQPGIAFVIADESADETVLEQTITLLKRLVAEKVPTLVWGASDKVRWSGGPMVEWLTADTSLDEIAGRLSTLVRYVPLMKRFERELGHLHRLGEQLNRYFGEIDQEMRLAGRLQRDFLPRSLPELTGYDFSLIYRPASWVSGDMYDVFRIDEQHWGIFLADAMGHGVAAGLLTMFLRQALVPKRITGSSYSIVSPPEAMTDLHMCLVRQQLPNCQFLTAVYAILNTQTRELRISRAGHPYPLHIHSDGKISQIQAGGGLLGLPDIEPEFEETSLRLEPGDKVAFFTDGLEDDFFAGTEAHSPLPRVTPVLQEWARLPVTEFADAICEHLDCKVGSLHPADDITLLTLQVGELTA